MDDTRHISHDQYDEIECALDDLLHNAEYSKENSKDECINTLLNILCLEKPDVEKTSIAVNLRYNITTYSEISKLWTVYADITKEEVKKLFDHEQKKPMNDNMEFDDSYTCGEVQFIFDSEAGMDLNQVLVFPSYADENGDISNGDFIVMTDYFLDEAVTNARKHINDDEPVKAQCTIKENKLVHNTLKKDIYIDPDFKFTISNSKTMLSANINFNRIIYKEDLKAMKDLIDEVLKEMEK